MNDQPRSQLRTLVKQEGVDIWKDARRCRGLINDYCGEFRREINLLIAANDEHVPAALTAASIPANILLPTLANRLQESRAITSEAAIWAVESWALALGIVTDEEVKRLVSEREPGRSAKRARAPATGGGAPTH